MLPEIDMNAEWGTNSIRIHSEFRIPKRLKPPEKPA
jgi:hypothetical protein